MTTSARKSIRLEGEGSSFTEESLKPSATMNDLPSEVLKNIFSFVGKGNYCFIGPVSKDFCFNYLTMEVIEDKFAHKMDYQLAIGKNRITTAEAASSSFDLAEYSFFKAPEKFQKQVVVKAILKGRKDIVELGHAMGVDIYRTDKRLTSIKDSISWEEIEEIGTRGDLGMFKLLQEKSVKFECYSWNIVCAAAGNDHLGILKWLHENNWLKSYQGTIFETAAKNGHLSIIKWAKEVAGFDIPKDLTLYAAESGNLDIIKYLRSKNISWNASTFCNAASSGNIELLQYLLENNCPHEDPYICTGAVENDDHEKALGVLKWLHNQCVPWNTSTCEVAAEKGNLKALKYFLKENDCPWNEECIVRAVRYCNVEVVEFLLQNGCPIGNSDICFIAMEDEDQNQALKKLKVLREFSVPWSGETCRIAAEKGYFAALKWAITQGCHWNRADCAYYAAMYGDIEFLKWMKSRGCQWDVKTGEIAACEGHVETLKWLKSEGCPWEYTFSNAIQSGNFAMVEYCVNNDHSSDYNFVYEYAIEHFKDPVPIIKLIQKKQYPWNERVCTKAASKGDLKLLRWLYYQGCPWDEETCNEAVKNNNLDILKYAHENGCPWTKDTYAYAYCSINNEFYNSEEIPTDHRCSRKIIIEYLRTHKCPQPDQEDLSFFFSRLNMNRSDY